MKNTYEVYVFLDQTKYGTYNYGEYFFDYEPFYVCKGKNGKYSTHLKGTKHNRELIDRINYIETVTKDDVMVLELYQCSDAIDATIEERTIVKTIGTITGKRYIGPLMNKDFSNVYDISVPNCDKETYILEHPYVTTQEVVIGENGLINFCTEKHLDYNDLLEGKPVGGWTLITL